MKTVKICGIPYKIIEVDYIEGNDRVIGEISYDECIIKIRKGQFPEYEKQTIIHEIVHGMLVQIGRNDLSNDETFVQTMALAISQTFDLRLEDNEGEQE